MLRHSARDEGRRDRVDLLGQECFVATVWSAPPDMSNAEAVQLGFTSCEVCLIGKSQVFTEDDVLELPQRR